MTTGIRFFALCILFQGLPAHAGSVGSPQFDIVRAASTLGDAWLFGGGDPFLQRLRTVRLRINGTLQLAQRKHEVAALCDANRCTGSAGNTVCRALEGLNDKQRGECRAFLVERADALVAVNQEKTTPVSVSQMPLTVFGAAGASISAAAMTQRGPAGAIVVHQGSVTGRSDAELTQLLVHELGHKVPVTGGFIDDNKGFGSFPTGRAFLDAIGAAVAVHAEHFLPPPQEPPAVPAELAVSACEAARGGDSIADFIVGLAIDTSGQTPTADELRTWRIPIVNSASNPVAARLALVQQVLVTPKARTHSIRRLFSTYLNRSATPEELALMVDRLGEGVTYDAIVASILGDDEYAKTRGALTFESFLNAAALDLHGKTLSSETLERFRRRYAVADRASVAHLLLQEGDTWHRLAEKWHRDWLNRAPAPAEIDAIVTQLKAGAGWESPIASLLAGGEYASLQSARWRRCSGAGAPSVAHR